MKKSYISILILFFIVSFFVFSLSVFGQEPKLVFFSQNLKFGSRGQEVKNLQALLKQLPGIYDRGKVTGYYGPATRNAVKRFQRLYKIRVGVSGVVESATRTKLNQVVSRLAFKEPSGVAPTSGVPPPATPLPASSPLPISKLDPQPYFTYSWKAAPSLTGEVSLPTSELLLVRART